MVELICMTMCLERKIVVGDFMKPFISIVTPVYNSFELMEKYFDSLEKQDADNFEVIIVDDCSTDDSYKKLKKKIKQCDFDCYLYKTQKNSGPGVARNLGIFNSSGRYITFVDSDDYIENNFIKEITFLVSDYDAIVVDYYKTNGLKCTPCNTILSLSSGIVNVSDAVALSSGSTWCKIYRADILKNNEIKFPNLMRGEDLVFNKVALSKCKNIFYLKKNLYYYYENQSSIMHNFDTLDILDNKKAYKYIENNLSLDDSLEMIFIREYLYLITQIMILKKYKTCEIKDFISSCFHKFPNWYKNKYIQKQPKYLQIILFFIKHKIIFPIRLIFQLKK